MPIKQESAQIFLNEVLQELSEINDRKKQLEDLIKHLQKVVGGELIGGEPTPSGAKSIRTPISILGARKIGHKRAAHSPRIAEILKKSGKATMRVPEIVAGFRERGWKLTKNGTDVIRRTIKIHRDLFLYKDGNVSLISQN
jgi:DNA repair exonuclease SbcCD ATPase subunit